MHLTPHMYKIITLKENAKEIITLKCVLHTYVQNHYLKANAKEIVPLKCI